MWKKFLIFLIRNTLTKRNQNISFEEANKYCVEHPELAPHIVIVNFNKSTVN